jgi:site-specific DNA-methyltransferase (adenine-specific)
MTIENTNDKLPTKPTITYSECYRLPFLSLFHADCMEIMKQYPDKYFDLAVVDPPYGIGENGQRNVTGDRPTAKWKNPKSQHYVTFDDSEIPTAEYWEQLFRVSKNQIVWGGNYFTEYLPPSKGWIVWDKQADIKEHLSMCELAWSSFDRKCNKFEYLWAGFKKKHQVERIHPTQKPVYLYDWILKNYAKEGDLILDTHFGSGSIALAVDKANRLDKMNLHLTACEIDKEYIDKAIKRISDSIKQGTLPF